MTRMSHKRIVKAAAGLAAICIGLILTAPNLSSAPLAIGSDPVPFTLKNVDGSMVSLSDYHDSRAVVIVFFCNHCPFAQAYQDRLIQLQNTYRDRRVEFILVNPNDPKKKPGDSFENMVKRAEEKKYPFRYLVDETSGIAKAYGATRTPEAYLFGPDRKLEYSGLIDDNTEPAQVKKHHLRDAIEMVLAGTPEKIEPRATKAFGCTIKWRDK